MNNIPYKPLSGKKGLVLGIAMLITGETVYVDGGYHILG